MQQTEKYKLNLIEKTDTFSPDPLNENMEKVEAAITAEAAALDQRLQVIEAHKIAIGSAIYAGNTVHLGFTPRALYAVGYMGTHMVLIDSYASSSGIRVIEGGFEHDGSFENCHYIAFA